MQRATAAPREHLTDAAVSALLHADTLKVSAGCELLSSALVPLEDVSDDLAGGTVERNMDATIHGTCRLLLSRELAWGTALVRPYMILSDEVTTARFNLGVFCMVTPEQKVGDSLPLFEVTGYDRLYLLAREVGDSYSVPAGTSYLTAVRDAITAAGLSGVLLDGSASAKTLPTAQVWPLVNANFGTDGRRDQDTAVTWLQIVNDLLGAINYRGVYCDENGLFRSEPYATPSARAVEFTFDTDALRSIVGQERSRLLDQWRSPNRWVFIQQNVPGDPPPQPVEGAGVYTVNNVSDGPSSQTGRGLVWAKVVKVDAADQPSLVALGDRIVADDRRVTTAYTVTTGPVPLAGHYDVLTYADTALGGPAKVQAVSWSLDLLGSDMRWQWEAVS